MDVHDPEPGTTPGTSQPRPAPPERTAIAAAAARSLAESRRRAAARERCRITHELQDLVGPHLSSLAAHGRAAALAARDLDEQSRDALDVSLHAVLDLTETALADLREFVSGLRATPGARQQG
jgi:signal transduction histidine kinase